MKILIVIIILSLSLSICASDQMMSGEFVIEKEANKAINGIDELIHPRFNVLKKSKKYQLEILEESGKGSCLFNITKISAPQQTRGLIGNISTYGKTCENLSKNSIWHEITSLSIRYNYSPKGELVGFAMASTQKHTFRFELDKIQLDSK